MRFSRRTLNIIILSCLVLISWIHLGRTDPEQRPLEPLQLPPLSISPWHRWQTEEGITSYWQQTALPHGQIRLLTRQHQDIRLPAEHWSQTLQQQPRPETPQPVSAILLQGPWQERQMQAISAWLIRHWQLQPASTSAETLGICEQHHAAGSLWFRSHWASPVAQLDKALPNRSQWQHFRQQRSRELRLRWLSHAGQLDIQSDIAYHRPPSGYYQHLYQALADSQKDAAAAYLNCKRAPAGKLSVPDTANDP